MENNGISADNKEKISFLIAASKSRFRSVIIELLRENGYKLFSEAEDGVVAFRMLKRRPIHCILASMDMPHMTGLSLLKVVSSDESLYNIPLILIARTMNRDVVLEAGQSGVAGILLEPVTSDALVEKLGLIMGSATDEKEIIVEDYFKKAEELTAAGKFDQALSLFKKILQVHEDAETYFNIGYIKSAQKKFDEAIIAFRKAVMINNLHARAFKMMGSVYASKGEPEEAEHCFKKAGEIFMERNMDSEAEDAFNEVIKINPDTVNIYNSLGIIYRRKSDYDGAIKQYERALKVDPEDENIYYNIGRACLEHKEIKKARRMFESALKLNPDFKEAARMIQAIEVGFK